MVSVEIGSYGTEVSIENVSRTSPIQEGNNLTVRYEVETGDVSGATSVDLEIVLFYVDTQNPARSKFVENVDLNSTESGTIDHPITDIREPFGGGVVRADPIYVEVFSRFTDSDGNIIESTYDDSDGKTQQARSTSFGILIEPDESDDDQLEFADETDEFDPPTPLSSSFNDRTPFAIEEIRYENDANVESLYDDLGQDGDVRIASISFDEYPNPTVSIDGAGRFVKHEIIGGATVRQKIGEEPLNLSINGVCYEDTANKIDSLRDAKNGIIYSNRLPGDNDSLKVHFGSTSTDPFVDGDAADATNGELLYNYSINCIEVIR